MKKGFKKALLGIGLSVMTLGASLFAGCSSVSNLRDQVDQIFCPHKTTKIVEAVTPTCTEDGYTGCEKCLDCGKEVTKGAVIEATGHTIKVTKGYAATCTTLGLTDKKTCTVCEAVIEEAKEVPATGHTFKDGECEACGAFLSGNDLQAGVDYTGYTLRLKYGREKTNEIIEDKVHEYIENLSFAFTSGDSIIYLGFTFYPDGVDSYMDCWLTNNEYIYGDFNTGELDIKYTLTLGEIIYGGEDINGEDKMTWIYTPSQNDYVGLSEEQLAVILDLIEFVPPASVEAAA